MAVDDQLRLTLDARDHCVSRLVLVGVDGSAASAAACGWAARYASKTGAQLVVASAWQPHQAEGTPEEFAARRADVQALLDGPWSAPARATGVAPHTVLMNGPPDVLLAEADSDNADLVVVGSRGAGGFASLHLGSVAHHLTHHTTRPLAIVPEPTAGPEVKTIVVGVDGSAGSAAAVDWCAAVAPNLGAHVVAVLVFEPLIEWVTEDNPKSWRRLAEKELAEWVAPLRDRGGRVDTRIIEDIHPVAALADAATEHSAQLIVVGTHGLGGFTKMRLGGVALQLVHHVGLPVVLVPPTSPHGSQGQTG